MEKVLVEEKILSDARAQADAMVSATKKRLDAELEVAQAELTTKQEADLEKAKVAIENENKQKALIKKIESDIAALSRKREILDEVFLTASKDLGKGVLTQLVTAFSKKAKAGDTVKKVDGGVIISNSKYELRLTVDELLKSLRGDIEAQVAQILFE
ncbi:MAG: hypothetical protein FWE16_05155 [Firmicutes bacterium]|nr:hypothetical protein [Bacillota bacterium]